MQLMLDAGADPELKAGKDLTALVYPSKGQGNVDVVKMLIEPGANSNTSIDLIPPSNPLSLSIACGNLPGAELIIKHGAILDRTEFLAIPQILRSMAWPGNKEETRCGIEALMHLNPTSMLVFY